MNTKAMSFAHYAESAQSTGRTFQARKLRQGALEGKMSQNTSCVPS